MKKVYDKLVRDKVIVVIENSGKRPLHHVAGQVEYHQRLREKLQEEVDEFFEDESLEELADVLEVVYALCTLKGVTFGELENVRREKHERRGGFEKGYVLEAVESTRE